MALFKFTQYVINGSFSQTELVIILNFSFKHIEVTVTEFVMQTDHFVNLFLFFLHFVLKVYVLQTLSMNCYSIEFIRYF